MQILLGPSISHAATSALGSAGYKHGGFPKMGYFFGDLGIIVFWGLCWGPPILGNYQMG